MKAYQLQHPDPTALLALTTFASETGIGAVLEQFTAGRPLGFWSRPDKRKLSTFRREFYAIQQGMRFFMKETTGRHTIIFTDHKPLIGAFKHPNSQAHDPIATNHIQEVAMFTSDVRYLTGKSNNVADFLSRPHYVPLGAAYTLPTQDSQGQYPDYMAAIRAALPLEILDQGYGARPNRIP